MSIIQKSTTATTILIAATLFFSPAVHAKDVDILITNGTIYDGTGNAPYLGDVVINAGKIVSVGRVGKVKAKTIIDATGLAVSPGFIDPHNHTIEAVLDLDGKFLVEQDIRQGVTTVIAGADGFESPQSLQHMFAAATTKGTSHNYSCYVGHNRIREEVMGLAQTPPTADQMEQMKALVRDGMEMGCVGLSAGLMYEPGMFSDPDEIVSLAKEVKAYDGIYDAHSRDPVHHFLASELETADIGIKAGIPAKLAHVKAVGLVNENQARVLIEKVEALQAAGHVITGDVYPYDGASTKFLSDIVLFPGQDPHGTRQFEDTKQRLKNMRSNPAEKALVKHATENGIDGGFSWLKAVGYSSLRIVDAPGQPELMDQYILVLAQERNQDPFDTMVDIVLNAKAPILVTVGAIKDHDLRLFLTAPWAMIASDGSHIKGKYELHPRSTGAFARVLGHYSRDQKLFSLEEAIRKMTSFTADSLRLYDRGRLQAGKNADVVIFDPNTIHDNSTYVKPEELATGVRDVIVNGQFVLRDNVMTGATPGGFVKRQSPITK